LRQTRWTSPSEQSSPNETTRTAYTRSPSTRGSSPPRKSTTKSTTRNSSQSSTASNTGDDTAKAPYTKCRCSPTTRISSTLLQPRYSTAGKLARHKNLSASTSKSSSDLAPRTASWTHYPGVRSTDLKKGGVRTSQSPRFCTHPIFRAESALPAQELSTFLQQRNSVVSQHEDGARGLQVLCGKRDKRTPSTARCSRPWNRKRRWKDQRRMTAQPSRRLPLSLVRSSGWPQRPGEKFWN